MPKRKRSQSGAPTERNSSFWICSACTLQNPHRRRRCEACHSRKPADAEVNFTTAAGSKVENSLSSPVQVDSAAVAVAVSSLHKGIHQPATGKVANEKLMDTVTSENAHDIEKDKKEIPTNTTETSGSSRLVGDWLSKRRERRKEKRLAAQTAFQQQFQQMRLRLFAQGEEILPPSDARPFRVALPRRGQVTYQSQTVGNETFAITDEATGGPEFSTDSHSINRPRDAEQDSPSTRPQQSPFKKIASVQIQKDHPSLVCRDVKESTIDEQSASVESIPQRLAVPSRSPMDVDRATKESVDFEIIHERSDSPSGKSQITETLTVDVISTPRSHESPMKDPAIQERSSEGRCNTTSPTEMGQVLLICPDGSTTHDDTENLGTGESTDSQLDGNSGAEGEALSPASPPSPSSRENPKKEGKPIRMVRSMSENSRKDSTPTGGCDNVEGTASTENRRHETNVTDEQSAQLSVARDIKPESDSIQFDSCHGSSIVHKENDRCADSPSCLVVNKRNLKVPIGPFSDREQLFQPTRSDSDSNSPSLTKKDVRENTQLTPCEATTSLSSEETGLITQNFGPSKNISTLQTPSLKKTLYIESNDFPSIQSKSIHPQESDESSILQSQHSHDLTIRQMLGSATTPQNEGNVLMLDDEKLTKEFISPADMSNTDSPQERHEERMVSSWQPITQRPSQTDFFYTQATQESQSSSPSQTHTATFVQNTSLLSERSPISTSLQTTSSRLCHSERSKELPSQMAPSTGSVPMPFNAADLNEAKSSEKVNPIQGFDLSTNKQQSSIGIMFQSAGSGRQLEVPAEALAKAGALFTSGNEGSSNSVPCFQSAGSGRQLEVPAEALAKAEALFTSGNEGFSNSVPCFQSAGSGRQLEVPAEALAKAEAQFTSGDDDIEVTALQANDIAFDNSRTIESKSCLSDNPEAFDSKAFLASKRRGDFSGAARKPSRVSITPRSDHDRGLHYQFTMADDPMELGTPRRPARVSIQTPGAQQTPGSFIMQMAENSAETRLMKTITGYSTKVSSRLKGPGSQNRINGGIISSSSVRRLDFQVDPSLDLAIASGNMADWEECKFHKIHQSILEVNSLNASFLRFNRDYGRPCELLKDESSVTNDDNLLFGSPDDWRSLLATRGYDSAKVSDKWIINHYRWVVWKLCSIERRFCTFLANNYVNVQKVGSHLCKRYSREITDGKRSPLRMVLNRDVTSRQTMILCVAAIFSRESNAKDDSGAYSLELTDGWYSILARLDSFLSTKVDDGFLCVGRKIMISNSVLVCEDDGVDPLDPHYTVTPDGDSPFLRVFANGTRVAHWRAKLGFVTGRHSEGESAFTFNVGSLKNVVPRGGAIPQINLRILERHPVKYLGARAYENNPRVVLSEKEEMDRRIKLEKEQISFMERIGEEVEKECLKEIDENAPDIWRQHTSASGDGSIDFENCSSDEAQLIQDWAQRRQELVSKRIKEEIECRLDEKNLIDRPSKPFLKLRVGDIDSHLGKVNDISASLTVWGPSEEQLEFLQEGSSFQMSLLSVKDDTYDGYLQLSANSRSTMVPIDVEICEELCDLSRSTTISMVKLHIISRQSELQKCHLFGICVIVLAVSETSFGWRMLAIDESGLSLRVESYELPVVQITPFSAVLFEGLLMIGYDHYDRCAIAQFTSDSIAYEDPNNSKSKQLHDWLEVGVESPSFASILSQCRFRMSRGKFNAKLAHAIAFIIDFETTSEGSAILIAEGLSERHKWRVPLSMISRLKHLQDENSTTVVHNEEKERRIVDLLSLGCILQHRTWLSFVLKPCNDEHQYEIADIERARIRSLLSLYCYSIDDFRET